MYAAGLVLRRPDLVQEVDEEGIQNLFLNTCHQTLLVQGWRHPYVVVVFVNEEVIWMCRNKEWQAVVVYNEQVVSHTFWQGGPLFGAALHPEAAARLFQP